MSNGNGLSPALAARPYRGIVDDMLSGLSVGRGPHLSIRAGRFWLTGGDGVERQWPQMTIDIVIVDAGKFPSRVFFKNKKPTQQDIESGSPPDCFSDNGVGPSTAALDPQWPTCAGCPNNKRGSALTFSGKPTTACDNRRKLAFILPDDPQVTVYELQIPPGSLGNIGKYGDWARSQASGVADRKTDVSDFVTEVSFDPTKQFVLQFRAVALADNDHTLQLVQYIYENGLSDAAVGRNDVAHDPEQVRAMLQHKPTPQLAAPAAEQAPQQAPAFQLPPRTGQQPVQGAAAPAPAPRRGRPRAVEAPQATPVAQQATPLAAPFVPPQAAPQGAQQVIPPVRDDGGIPSFLQRAPAAAPGTPPAPPVRNGVGAAPPPPQPLSEALGKAMALPTRR